MTDALSRDFKLDDLFESIHKIKMATQVPIVLFSYLNPMLHNGLRKNLKQAKKNGVDGLLLIDMPLEESQEYFAICKEIGLEPVGLLSPTTPLHRVQLIDSHCQSFLYYVCRNGVTGVKSSLPRGFQETMDAFQGVSQAPIVCGFGIGDRVLAKEALEHAAGFVVGSAFVSAISEGATPTDLSFLAQEIDPR
jgi:tryptophan synthase alpha chain